VLLVLVLVLVLVFTGTGGGVRPSLRIRRIVLAVKRTIYYKHRKLSVVLVGIGIGVGVV
jgi:nucleoside phosphorylase